LLEFVRIKNKKLIERSAFEHYTSFKDAELSFFKVMVILLFFCVCRYEDTFKTRITWVQCYSLFTIHNSLFL